MSILFIILSSVYIVGCLALISMILMQKKRSAGLGGMTGMGASQNYWDKNKSRSFEGKLEKYTKVAGFFLFVLTLVLCVVK